MPGRYSNYPAVCSPSFHQVLELWFCNSAFVDTLHSSKLAPIANAHAHICYEALWEYFHKLFEMEPAALSGLQSDAQTSYHWRVRRKYRANILQMQADWGFSSGPRLPSPRLEEMEGVASRGVTSGSVGSPAQGDSLDQTGEYRGVGENALIPPDSKVKPTGQRPLASLTPLRDALPSTSPSNKPALFGSQVASPPMSRPARAAIATRTERKPSHAARAYQL